jgi:AcrR family transcriptional regulator
MADGPENETRGRILKAALKLATRKGIAAVTMVSVAEAAGVTRQTVYFYFKSRVGLLAETVRLGHVSHGVAPELLAISRGPATMASFEAFIRAWFRFVPDQVALALAIQAESTHDKAARAAWRSRQDSLIIMVERIVGGLEAAGLLRPGWSVREASEWVSMHLDPATFHGLVTLRGWPTDRLAERVLDALMRDLFVA